MKRTDPHRPAFTLVEMLVVILLIAVLIAILLPALARAREAARQITCQSNMRQFGVAFANYATQMNGVMPPAGAWLDPDGAGGPKPAAAYSSNLFGTVQPYLGAATQVVISDTAVAGWDNEVFRCPADSYNTLMQAGYSYGFNYWGPTDTNIAGGLASNGYTGNRDYCPFSMLDVTSSTASPTTVRGEAKYYSTSPADTFLMVEFWGIDRSTTATRISYLALDSPDKLCKPALGGGAGYGDTNRWTEGAGGTMSSRVMNIGSSVQQWPTAMNGLVGFRYAFHRGRANFLFMDGHVDGWEVMKTAGMQVVAVKNWTGIMD